MKIRIFFTIIISLFFPFHIISQTQPIVSKPRLELSENKLTIEYDILNSQPIDTFKIWVEVTDVNGNIIKASSLSGDYGEKIKGGMNRKIIWDLKQDNLIIREEIFVEVMAEKRKTPEVPEESISVEKTSISKVKTISKGNMVLSSLVLPGWGQSKFKERKPYLLMGLTAYGCFAGSITLNRLGVSNYDDYLTSTDYDESNTLYDKSVKQDNISEYLAYSAIAIWTANLIWVLVTPGLSKEQIVFHKYNNFKIKPGYDPYSNSTVLILSYQF